jgi:hypothetical protein
VTAELIHSLHPQEAVGPTLVLDRWLPTVPQSSVICCIFPLPSGRVIAPHLLYRRPPCTHGVVRPLLRFVRLPLLLPDGGIIIDMFIVTAFHKRPRQCEKARQQQRHRQPNRTATGSASTAVALVGLRAGTTTTTKA